MEWSEYESTEILLAEEADQCASHNRVLHLRIVMNYLSRDVRIDQSWESLRKYSYWKTTINIERNERKEIPFHERVIWIWSGTKTCRFSDYPSRLVQTAASQPLRIHREVVQTHVSRTSECDGGVSKSWRGFFLSSHDLVSLIIRQNFPYPYSLFASSELVIPLSVHSRNLLW